MLSGIFQAVFVGWAVLAHHPPAGNGGRVRPPYDHRLFRTSSHGGCVRYPAVRASPATQLMAITKTVIRRGAANSPKCGRILAGTSWPSSRTQSSKRRASLPTLSTVRRIRRHDRAVAGVTSLGTVDMVGRPALSLRRLRQVMSTEAPAEDVHTSERRDADVLRTY